MLKYGRNEKMMFCIFIWHKQQKLFWAFLMVFDTRLQAYAEIQCGIDLCMMDGYNYTPGIFAEGYIVFVFPFVGTYVCSFVCSFVRTFVLFVELLQSFTLKQLEWRISHQPSSDFVLYLEDYLMYVHHTLGV